MNYALEKIIQYHQKLHSNSGTLNQRNERQLFQRNTPTYFSTSGVIGFSLLGEETSYTCYKWIKSPFHHFLPK